MYRKTLSMFLLSCFVMGIMAFVPHTIVNGRGICDTQVDNFAISPDGALLATFSSVANSIYVFDTSNYELNTEVEVTQDRVTSIAFSIDNELMAWSESDDSIDGHSLNGSLYLYDMNSQTIDTTIENVADLVDQISFLDGFETLSLRGLYPGYERSDIQIWDIVTQTRVSQREAWSIVTAYSDNIASIFLGTTLSLGMSNEFSYQIEVWDGQSNTVRETVEFPVTISAMALSDDNISLATGDIDGQITLWDADDLTQLSSFHSNTELVEYLEFVEDNILVAVGNEGTEMRIAVWRTVPEPELLADMELSVIQIDADPSQATIYILNEADDATQLAVWDYAEDSLTPLNLDCN